MQYSYRLLYFDLLPPSPFLRETNKVAFFFWLCILLMAFGWSANVVPNDPFRGITTDVIIVGSLAAEIWYVSLFTTSTWRLSKYKQSARQMTPEIYQLLYPWGAIIVVNSTVLLFALVDRSSEKSTAGSLLYKVLMTELTPFLAFEIPIIKKWIPQFEPMRFVHIFQKSLAILLGREFGIDGELHAKNIVEFQYDFSRFLEGDDKHMDVADDNYAQYRNGQTLAVFQSTLSCVFETGEFIGKKVNEYFRGRHWTMLDVGGGEGMFTSELLSKCQTLPQVLTMLDPNESNVRAYRTCISARFDNLRNLDAYAKGVEDVIDDVPIVTFLLASHSLYAVFDRSRSRGAQLVQQLVRQTRDGFAIFIAASQDSYLYTIKKTVLGHLHRIDRSSYGEDLCKAMTAEMGHTVESFDSIVDVSALLEDYEGLIFWLSYFCRVDTEEIRPYYDLCHALIRDTAIDIKCLPKAERFRMEENGTIKRMGLTESSKIVYHKEVIITVPSARHIARI